ncbi:MAG: hypothetical protein ACYS22_15425 [Planctomycetota bacterium]
MVRPVARGLQNTVEVSPTADSSIALHIAATTHTRAVEHADAAPGPGGVWITIIDEITGLPLTGNSPGEPSGVIAFEPAPGDPRTGRLAGHKKIAEVLNQRVELPDFELSGVEGEVEIVVAGLGNKEIRRALTARAHDLHDLTIVVEADPALQARLNARLNVTPSNWNPGSNWNPAHGGWNEATPGRNGGNQRPNEMFFYL